MNQNLPLTADDREFLLTLRRDLHRHPELSWQETRTQQRLERALADAGVRDVRRVARTGLVGRVPGTGRSAPVAVRGDIDALPITEATGLPYASAVEGVMHACGHDVHATWAVGAALLLARQPAAGDVLVVLQPAEEVGEGARAIVESGALDGAGAMFGGHVDWRFDVGQVVAQPGPLAASTDTLRIVVQGQSAHGARPHLSRDPVVAAAAIVLALQTIVSRRLRPSEAGVVTIGSVHGGKAPNAIPDVVELTGTLRATTVSVRQLLVSEVAHVAEGVAAAHGVSASVTITQGTPPLVNSSLAAGWAVEAVTRVLGADARASLTETNTGGEDFAFYAERMPACFLRVGARAPGGVLGDVHTPRFAPAEEAIFVGAAVLAECARTAADALSGASSA